MKKVNSLFTDLIHEVKHAADGIAGIGIGEFFFATSHPGMRHQRRAFGGSQKIHFKNAFGVFHENINVANASN